MFVLHAFYMLTLFHVNLVFLFQLPRETQIFKQIKNVSGELEIPKAFPSSQQHCVAPRCLKFYRN